MKKRHLFMPFVAALALAGCSNDEFGSENEPNGGNGDDSYIAVNIVAPRDLGSRADDGGFEIGTDDENKATTGVFLFYDEAGNPTQTPQTVELEWTDKTSTTPQVEKISEAVVVIAGNTAPTQVLVILNAPSTARLENQTISQVKALVGEYAYSEAGTFMMTNTVYVDGEGEGKTEVCATDIKGQTYKTEAEAQQHPQDIYVERILAKVRTSATPDDFAKGAEIEINGVKCALKQEIGGIEIANVAKRSYLFKSISGWTGWETDYPAWNDAPNKRCYWATTPTAMDFVNESWTKITTDPSEKQTFYIQENTTAQRTSVLITATLKDNNNQAISFVRWAGKYYFKDNTEVGDKTVEGFLKQYAEIVKNAGFRLRIDNGDGTHEYKTIDKTYFKWLSKDDHKAAVDSKKLNQYEMTAQVVKPEGEIWTVVKSNGTVDATSGAPNYDLSSLDDINTALFDKVNRVWLWEDGKCYYFKEIEHLNGTDIDPAAVKIGQLGVVRNHIYDLTLNSLTGVGVPVYNPDEIIIPQKPSDELFYLAARINILKWKVVKQTVDFE